MTGESVMSEKPFRGTIVSQVPLDWFAKESLKFLEPSGQANVIVSSEPLDLSIDSARYATVQGDLLEKEFPMFRQFSFESRQMFGGRPGYIRIFEWAPPDGVPVTQVQIYYAERGRGYTATATTPSTRFEEFREALFGILTSLDIDTHAAPPRRRIFRT